MCNHYWKIEEPDGPTSKGKCLRCGNDKVFHNSIPGNHVDPYSNRRPQRQGRKVNEGLMAVPAWD